MKWQCSVVSALIATLQWQCQAIAVRHRISKVESSVQVYCILSSTTISDWDMFAPSYYINIGFREKTSISYHNPEE